ncbi:Acetyl esterase (plasmid) [Asticcacaulis sp. MM231]|uniref:alpha/beta hydrolase fold domain-containing protein n=1 Tax=Asticcacaulis sp. MM231 TaxID=3157666 RepID=UPI0032D58D19
MMPPVSAFGADLDPDIRRFIQETGAAYGDHPPFDTLSPDAMRAVCEAVRTPWRQGGPVMVRTEAFEVATPHGRVNVRLLDPTPASDAPKPCLVYVHGGGWMLFSMQTHDRVMREYAARASVVVIAMDYAYAPAAKFPVALEQVVATLRWTHDHAAELGIDPDRIAIGGDSVGGNMSVATALMLRDVGEGDLLKGLMLHYGAFDDDSSPEDHIRYGGEGYMLSSAEMVMFWDNYLNNDADHHNPLAVPMRADVTGLPPAFFTIPQCDVLSGQSRIMAERFKAAGIATQVEIYPGASHSFLEAVSISPLAEKAIHDGAMWLARLFATVKADSEVPA